MGTDQTTRAELRIVLEAFERALGRESTLGRAAGAALQQLYNRLQWATGGQAGECTPHP